MIFLGVVGAVGLLLLGFTSSDNFLTWFFGGSLLSEGYVMTRQRIKQRKIESITLLKRVYLASLQHLKIRSTVLTCRYQEKIKFRLVHLQTCHVIKFYFLPVLHLEPRQPGAHLHTPGLVHVPSFLHPPLQIANAKKVDEKQYQCLVLVVK